MMNSPPRGCRIPAVHFFALIAVLALAGMSLAQDDPFGTAGDDPFGTGATTKPTGRRPRGAKAAPVEKDPVVLALRESNPTTPVELTRALRAMMDYGRADEAQSYLTRLIGAAAAADDKVAIRKEFGSAFFIRLSRFEPLAPEGIPFARAVMAAGDKAARDPARLAKLIGDLSNASPGIRVAALDGLTDGGVDSVKTLIQALADSSRASQHARIRGALAHMGIIAIEPMIGVLEAPHEDLVIQAMKVLGRLEASRAVLYLVRPYADEASSEPLRQAAGEALMRIVDVTPSNAEVQEFLRRRAKLYNSGTLPLQPGLDGTVELWSWDEGQKTSLPRRYPAEVSSYIVASKVAGDLYALSPNDQSALHIYLSSLLEAAKLSNGLGQSLPEPFLKSFQANLQDVEDVLKKAMKDNHPAAAIGAAEVLGFAGDSSMLYSGDGRPRVLASALRNGDRRLRFAAANAILRINPDRPYPGSSHLLEVLAYLVRSAGQRRVLIGHPVTLDARSLVGLLATVGIGAETAPTGRTFFELAVADSDYEYLMLSDSLDRPNFKETFQQLRRDPRTAKIPVALFARSENYERLKDFARDYELVEVFPWPYDAAALSFVTRQMAALSGRNYISTNERLNQAVVAMDGLVRIAKQPRRYSFYDLLRHERSIVQASISPVVADKARFVLGQIGSPQSQRTLVELASDQLQPLAQRQMAASSFAQAVQARGVLLTSEEILRQYDRYNDSERLDGGTQAVLASLLDTIEAKRNQQDEIRKREVKSRRGPSSR